MSKNSAKIIDVDKSLNEEKESIAIISSLIEAGFLYSPNQKGLHPPSLFEEALRLSSAQYACQQWKEKFNNKVIIIGEQNFCEGLKSSLNEMVSARVKYVNVPIPGLSHSIHKEHTQKLFIVKKTAQNKKQDSNYLKILKSALIGKKILICCPSSMSLTTAKEIYNLASENGVFTIFCSVLGSDKVLVRPLLAPSLEGSVEYALKGGLDFDISDEHRYFSKMTNVSLRHKGALKLLTDILARSLATPTLPLLWNNVVIVRGEVTMLSAHNHDLINVENHSIPGLSLNEQLNPKVMKSKKVLTTIRADLKKGSLVTLNNAFAEEFARLMHESLDQCSKFRLYEQFFAYFHFRHHNLYDPVDYPPELLTSALVFSHSKSKELITWLTGNECEYVPTTVASWYMPGDHSLPHTDDAFGRKVAFVWHLTKGWQPNWGGNLYWAGGGAPITPAYNALHLFIVSEESSHMVTQVVPFAMGKRLTVNGWWNGQQDFRPNEKKEIAIKIIEGETAASYPPLKIQCK